MFGDINEVRVMGNMTRDPELRKTNSGTSVCNFSVATNRRYQQNNEWKEDVEFHNVVIWGRRAESFVERAKKGTRLYIEGRLQTRSWEDQNGSKQFKTEIIVSKVILIDRYDKPESSGSSYDNSSGTNDKPAPQAKKPEKKKPSNDDESIDPDDLPF